MLPPLLLTSTANQTAPEDDEDLDGVHIFKFSREDLDRLATITQASMGLPPIQDSMAFGFTDGALAFTSERGVVMLSRKEINSTALLALAAGLGEEFSERLPDIIAYALSALSEVDNDEEIAFREWLESYELPTVAVVAVANS